MSDHDPSHDHAHDHTHEGIVAGHDGPLTHYQTMEIALRELLIEKGIFTSDDVRREVEAMEGRDAGSGARMVARAWVDPAYKALLLSDAKAAAARFGFEAGPFRILVMENTPDVHNMICAPATHACCSVSRRPGTRGSPIAAVPSANPAPCWPNSARPCRITSPCGSTIRRPTCVTWCCPCARPGRTAGARSGWPRLSRVTA